jgi:hypothetical protein
MRVRKRLFGALCAVLSVIPLTLSMQNAAHAETSDCTATRCWVAQDTATGFCQASAVLGTGDYVYGVTTNQYSGLTCVGWLERSTDGGHHWSVISGYHVVDYNAESTGQYWDGPGYLARGCFDFTFIGAAVHCSRGI